MTGQRCRHGIPRSPHSLGDRDENLAARWGAASSDRAICGAYASFVDHCALRAKSAHFVIIGLELGIDHLRGTGPDEFGKCYLHECAASASLSCSFGRRRRATKAVRCRGSERVRTEFRGRCTSDGTAGQHLDSAHRQAVIRQGRPRGRDRCCTTTGWHSARKSPPGQRHRANPWDSA